MHVKPRLTRFYSMIYGLIVLIAIISLMINNKTMAVNDKTRKLSQKIDQFNEINTQLNLIILSKDSLQNIDTQARFIGMVSTGSILLKNIK
jgi:cell division protein FtsL